MSQNNDLERQVRIPRHIVSRIEDRVESTDFESVSEYVEFVLEEVVSRVEQRHETESADVIDEEEIESRLKSLGYLNE